jgi:hypothetical protein
LNVLNQLYCTPHQNTGVHSFLPGNYIKAGASESICSKWDILGAEDVLSPRFGGNQLVF